MPSFDFERPTSITYLRKLFDKVFIPLKNSYSVRLQSFPGSGKWANIKVIIDNINHFDSMYPLHAYLFLDANNLAFSPLDEVKAGINFMYSKAQRRNDVNTISFLDTIPEISSSFDLTRTFQKLIHQYGKEVVLIIDNAESLLILDRYAQKSAAFLQSLLQIDVRKIRFLFLSKGNIYDDINNLNFLNNHYNQNIVYEKDIPFEKDSVLESILLFADRAEREIPKEHQIIFSTLGRGNASITKFLLNEYINNTKIEDLFNTWGDRTKVNKKLYSLINREYLDQQFLQIMNSLNPTSKKALIEQKSSVELQNLYLLDADDEFINLVFHDYVERYRKSIEDGLNKLSSQEKTLVELLMKSASKIVTREEIAKHLWKEEWKEKYSDQAIDKLVSKIRSKTKDIWDYDLRSIKGEGVLLERKQ